MYVEYFVIKNLKTNEWIIFFNVECLFFGICDDVEKRFFFGLTI